MATQKLVLDDFIDEQEFTLIGIHCAIENYRLAYLLNQYCNLKLVRKSKDLDFINKAQYPIYEWCDTKKLTTWSLVSNNCKVRVNLNQGSGTLFTESGSVKNYYLIPEYQKVNYFLKISSDTINDRKLKLILNKIQNIPQIVTAYSVKPDTLKSKNNLIFY
ncbi:IPExxxVDY family protein [Hanstruepera marina]|uniref:IPExxxVDY family protein n=1 Tax=Hanstruepera marina TaxID=2873265 RepID=UPI001CA77D2E|nr:IPExxxVDY family protein [Hanstruepera marina]